MQIVPALNQYGKDTDQAHTEVSKTQAQTFYTFIAAYPTSCLAYRNFLSITPAMIWANNVNRDIPPYDKKMYLHLPTCSQLHKLHSIE